MHIKIDHTTKLITEWAADYGIPVRLIRSRLKRGWNEERAVTEPMVVRRGEKLPVDAMLDLPPAPRPFVPSPYLHASARQSLAVLSDCRRDHHASAIQRQRARPKRQKRVRSGQIGRIARSLTFNHIALTIPQWAERLGVQPQLIRRRLRDGLPLEHVLDGRIGPTSGNRCLISG